MKGHIGLSIQDTPGPSKKQSSNTKKEKYKTNLPFLSVKINSCIHFYRAVLYELILRGIREFQLILSAKSFAQQVFVKRVIQKT